MFSIIVAFPKIEDANRIKSMLTRSGFQVYCVCTNGAMAIQTAEELDNGILISGCKFHDMTCREIKENLPIQISMLVLASKRVWEVYGGDNIFFLEMPIKAHDLINTLNMMIQVSEKYRKKRKINKNNNSDKNKIILKAKIALMEKNKLSEEEAYRYIQKSSMDSGNNMSDTAAMLLSLMGFSNHQ